MKVYLPDNSELIVNDGASVLDVASSISEGLARNAVAGKVNGVAVDLSHKVSEGDKIAILTLRDEEGLDVYRHTCSHVLAQAVKTIYPTCNLAIGPTTATGFYYDIDFKTPITLEDLSKIEEEMKKIIKFIRRRYKE